MVSRTVKAWLPVVAMCVVIFLFSQDANSGRHSQDVLGWLLSLVGMDTHHRVYQLDGPFRKCAHVLVYFILGALTYRGFSMGQRRFSGRAAWRALVFSALYAASDEYHQRFIPGRGPSPRDVMLDTSAAVLALVVIWLWMRGRNEDGHPRAVADRGAVTRHG